MTALPTGLKVVLGIELVVAILFLAMGWSHTSSMTFGRTPAFADIVALAAPVGLVILAAVLARAAVRRGQLGLAWLLTLLPFPIAMILAMLIGMV